MDLKEKVADALRRHLQPEHVELDDEDGISGVVVSSRFQRMSALDRQKLISDALRDSSKLTKPELRKILAIAGLTPVEYDALGSHEKPRRR